MSCRGCALALVVSLPLRCHSEAQPKNLNAMRCFASFDYAQDGSLSMT